MDEHFDEKVVMFVMKGSMFILLHVHVLHVA